MPILNKSVLIGNLNFVQLKLFDFSDKERSFENAFEKNLFIPEKSEKTNRFLSIIEKGKFRMIKPVCPSCNSLNYTKQGFYSVKSQLENGEKGKIFLQRYKCKSCGKKYSTKLNNLKESHKKFFKVIKDKIRQSKKNRGGSLRKIAKDIKNFLNIDISHQTVKNILRIDQDKVIKEKNRIIRKFNQLSGYYIIDEQFIKINGKNKYRVTLHDAFIKNPIAEEIMTKRNKKKIKTLIRDVTYQQPKISLTTDGFSTYNSIAKELGLKHQKCIFHMIKECKKVVYNYFKKSQDDEIIKMSIARHLTEINNIMRCYNENESVKLYYKLLEQSEYLPTIINKILTQKIMPNFENLIMYSTDNFIPRTSNQAEQHYSKTRKIETKRKYRKEEGILEYLSLFMETKTT